MKGVRMVVGMLAVLALSGCVGEEEPAPDPASSAPSAGSAAPGAGAPRPTGVSKAGPVDAARAVFPPVWDVGVGWTYEVSGARVRETYSVALGVVAVADDHYVIGADNEAEFEESLLGAAGVFLDGIQKDSLALKQGDNWHDFIGFTRADGESWEANLFTETFRLVKVGVGDVAGPDGPGLGIRVEGISGPETLVVEYHDAARFVSLFEWKNATGAVQVSYALTGFTPAATPGLLRWEVTDHKEAVAEYVLAAVGGTTWASDGSGDHVFIVGKAGRHMRPASGTVLDPEHEQRFSFTSTSNMATRDSAVTSDAAGDWQLLAASAGPRLSLVVFQIEVVTYA